MGRTAEPRRIVVAGGGIVGLAFALAVRRAAPGALAATVCDPAFAGPPRPERRAYAIAAAPRRMLVALGVWERIAASAEPMRAMTITDGTLADPFRQAFLDIEGEATPGEPFAHLVEGGALARALREAAAEAGAELAPLRARRADAEGGGVRVRLDGGEEIAGALAVAADGKRSRLREAAGIGWSGWAYPQSGLVATIAHERPHEGRAVQHFLPSGPFAILPLPAGGPLGRRSSIVWSERRENVPRLLALDADDLLGEIERRFGLEYGRIALESPLEAFPLEFGVARAFVGERLALVGDAAHVVHPIAGQGVNLGLKDAAALAEIVVGQARLGLDPGDPEALRAYQRARRPDAVRMGIATDALNRLFSNDFAPARALRDVGLGLVDRLPALKRLFVREASGLPGPEGPRLLRGEAL